MKTDTKNKADKIVKSESGLLASLKNGIEKCSAWGCRLVEAIDRYSQKPAEACATAGEKAGTAFSKAGTAIGGPCSRIGKACGKVGSRAAAAAGRGLDKACDAVIDGVKITFASARTAKGKAVMGCIAGAIVVALGVVIILGETAPYAAYADGTMVEEPYSIVTKDKGKTICILESEKKAKEVVKQVKSYYLYESSEVEECSLTPSVQIVETELKRGEEPPLVSSVDDAVKYIVNGTKETSSYTVKEGDTLWSISDEVDLSIDELQEMNPKLDIDEIYPGDTIKTYKMNPIIDVETTEVYTKDEVIQRKVKYVKDSSMYKGEKEVTSEGHDGLKSVTRRVTKKNGEVVDSDVLESTVKKESSPQIVHKGTKSRPVATSSTGSVSNKTYNSASYYTSWDSSKGQAVASYACQFLGNPYVYGGSSLTGGTDCSGFTMSVYANFGVSLPHSSYAQRSCGVAVAMDDLKPGDIICYSGHVALYIGGGRVVHASSPSTGIIISSVYHMSPICARRIFT